jgi:hypothetical protein
MTEGAGTTNAVREPLVVLIDGVGGTYAVPLTLAEHLRAPDAVLLELRKRDAEDEATGEVTGYGAMLQMMRAPSASGLTAPLGSAPSIPFGQAPFCGWLTRPVLLAGYWYRVP